MPKNMKELRRFSKDQLDAELERQRKALMDVKSQLSSGGSIDDPGRIKEIKKTIARLLTLKREEELGINQ